MELGKINNSEQSSNSFKSGCLTLIALGLISVNIIGNTMSCIARKEYQQMQEIHKKLQSPVINDNYSQQKLDYK